VKPGSTPLLPLRVDPLMKMLQQLRGRLCGRLREVLLPTGDERGRLSPGTRSVLQMLVEEVPVQRPGAQ
jgi:hypothetical protein